MEGGDGPRLVEFASLTIFPTILELLACKIKNLAGLRPGSQDVTSRLLEFLGRWEGIILG